ncbi:hypothetical protein ACF0H5_019172 [Mactra antiquata]
MESDSDSDVEETCPIIRTTVLQEIQQILEQYRNDVQIIKELVQNADDAGASEFKILYQPSTFNDEKPDEKHFRKFLRAPAFVCNNDAVFSDDDWKGLRSLCTSPKADDIFKVGRFGLGFKSIFHLTDYPCILSGDQIMFIDPQQSDERKICTVIKLRNIKKSKRIDYNDFLNAFDDTFDFTENIVAHGNYPGTIFWFPLRKNASLLSDFIYTEADVKKLIDSFLIRSEWYLIFTKTLCKIDVFVDRQTQLAQTVLYSRNEQTSFTELGLGKKQACFTMCCSLLDCKSVREKKREIQTRLKELGRTVPQRSMFWTLDMRIKTTTMATDITENDWLVIIFLKGGNIGENTQNLLSNSTLNYHHIVAIATRTTALPGDADGGAGHVFCYQPLPQESQKSITGLPVHVNAFFALGNNRRQIKWEDNDAQFSLLSDPGIAWNHALREEILPYCYRQLVLQMIEKCIKTNNKPDYIRMVYRMFPDYDKSAEKWKSLVEKFYHIIQSDEICVTEKSDGKWQSIENVHILSRSSENWFESIRNRLIADSINIAVIPDKVVDMFQKMTTVDVKEVTPRYFADHLVMREGYKKSTPEEKSHFLQFINKDSLNFMSGSFELLPLHDGTYTNFDEFDEPIFMEDADVVELFPKNQSRFVSANVSTETTNIIKHIKDSGRSRVKKLGPSAAAKMVDRIIMQLVPSRLDEYWTQWLQKTWEFIQSRYEDDFEVFRELNIFPYHINTDGSIELCKMSDHILHITSHARNDKNILQALKLLSVRVIDSIPRYLRRDIIQKYILEESTRDMLCLFENIGEDNIASFNNKINKDQQASFVLYLSNIVHENVPEKCKSKLKKMKLFRQYESMDDQKCNLVGITKTTIVFNESIFPVKFPRPLVKTLSSNELELAKLLGATVYDKVEMVKATLKFLQSNYSQDEREKFILWVMKDQDCTSDEQVITKLMNLQIRYVETPNGSLKFPKELFDPDDDLLCRMFRFENKFPDSRWRSDYHILQSLKKLGLLLRTDVTVCDIEATCRNLHNKASYLVMNQSVLDAAEAVLEFLNIYPNLYSQSLENLRIVPIYPVPNNVFPECIGSKNDQLTSLRCISEVTSSKHIHLIGTTRYTRNCPLNPYLIQKLKWDDISLECVLKHFENVINKYDVRRKSEFVLLTTRIYEWFAEQNRNKKQSIKSDIRRRFAGKPFVWNGDKYVPPNEVCTTTEVGDVDLFPFVTILPTELHHLKLFFEDIGCIHDQDVALYVSTLTRIKSATEEGEIENNASTLRVITDIFQKLVDKNDPSWPQKFPYVPVLTNSRLSFELIEKCVYSDEKDQISSDENNDTFTTSLPCYIAMAIGVKSVHQQMLSGTYAFEEWGQEEPITTKLRNLIKHAYTDGFSIIKEMFQNAEDAKASKFKLMFDHRQNQNARSNLICDKLKDFQGSALWVYNDAVFSEEDLKNIRLIGEGSKGSDYESIGKFGLGFCSVYNITDLPSLITGKNMVIFDPHSTNLSNEAHLKTPGLRIDFTNERNKSLIKKCTGQFMPFENVFGCCIGSQDQPYFKGSIFRLPFRTQGSDISDIIYTTERMESLFTTVIDNISDLLLFSENVTNICVYELPSTSSDPSKAHLKIDLTKRRKKIDSTYTHDVSVLQEISRIKNTDETFFGTLSRLEEVTVDTKSDEAHDIHDVWLVATSTCSEEKNILMISTVKNEVPIGAVAIPIRSGDSFKEEDPQFPLLDLGRFFCTLPIGVLWHSFPFHINGRFMVSMERQHIIKTSGERLDNTDATWNQMLMSDSVVTALVYSLCKGTRMLQNYYMLWPHRSEDQLERQLTKSFYKRIADENTRLIMNHDRSVYKFSEVQFLHPEALERMRDYNISVSTIRSLVKGSSLIVEIPLHIFENLLDVLVDEMECKVVSAEQFILQYLLQTFEPDIQPISVEERNRLVEFALSLKSELVKSKLKSTACIPTDIGTRACPSDLIDKESDIGKLFSQREGFFPDDDFLKDTTVHELRELGLRHLSLSDNLVLNRAHEIIKVYNDCAMCAQILCERFLLYLSLHIVKEHSSVAHTLATVPFIPIMQKPPDWPFIWKADSFLNNLDAVHLCNKHVESNINPIVWEQPKKLFSSACLNLLGCSQCFVDTNLFELKKDISEVLAVLGIRYAFEELDVDLLIDNLLVISEDFFNVHIGKEQIGSIMEDIYNCLDRRADLSGVQSLQDVKCIFVNNTLVCSKEVSLYSYEQQHLCLPFIYSLADMPIKRCPKVCEALNIRERFSATDIVDIIQAVKSKYNDMVLSAEITSSVIGLLKCLYSSLDNEDNMFIAEHIDRIYAPDERRILQLCSNMCFDDSAIEKTKTMIYVHDDVPRKIATAFGVKSKYHHQLEETSDDLVDFYQHEPLASRLRRLIDGYPCDSGLFRELLQNADDAGCKTVTFLLDFDTHKSDLLLCEDSKPLQGPALCVFNDRSFSADDLKGIQNLGLGGKYGDFTTIGKFGVGFNSVYNLTDVPSFLTKGDDVENGETLCIFDPLAKHLPIVSINKPGKRYKNLNHIRKIAKDLFLGYHEDVLSNHSAGTMFRFPLRTDVSDIKPDSFISMPELEEILQKFSVELIDSVIFLRSIEHVKILHYKNESYIDYYNLHINVPEDSSDIRRKSFESHKKLCSLLKNKNDSILKFDQDTFQYCLDVCTINSHGENTKTTVEIVQTYGFKNKECKQFVLNNKPQVHRKSLVPQGGVASFVQNEKCFGKAYCFLPLPIFTGLPCHVTGHFALDHETRRSLWKADDVDSCYKTQWNLMIIRDVIVQAYKHFLLSKIQKCGDTYPHNMKTKDEILSFFPILEKTNGFYWKKLVHSLYKLLFDENCSFLPSLHLVTKKSDKAEKAHHLNKNKVDNIIITWEEPLVECDHQRVYTVSQKTMTFDHDNKKYACTLDKPTQISQSCLTPILRSLGLRIVDIPENILTSMKSCDQEIPNLTAQTLVEFICSYNDDKCCCCNLNVGEDVKNTKFKTCKNVSQIFEFCLSGIKKVSENIDNFPLFMTEDEVLRTLSKSKQIFVTNFTHLFLYNQKQRFLHKELLDVVGSLKMKSICKQESRKLNYEEISKGMLKRLTVSDFVCFATRNETVFKQVDGVSQTGLHERDRQQITEFWKFFCSEVILEQNISTKEPKGISLRKELQNLIDAGLDKISSLCLIPAYDPSSSDVQMLVPFNKIDILIDLDSFVLGSDLYNAILQFGIYRLDKELIEDISYLDVNAYDIIHHYIPKMDMPAKVLRCLQENIEKINASKLDCRMATALLRYFNDHIKAIFENAKIITKFPVFETHDGRLKKLEGYAKKFVLPDKCPREGLEILGNHLHALLLKDQGVDDLYQANDICKLEVDEMYLQLVFPNYMKMPYESFSVHLDFICRHLSAHTGDLRSLMLNTMRNLKIIKVSDRTSSKRVCDLFYDDVDDYDKLFQNMCQEHELLPEQYRCKPYIEIFKEIGLQYKMTSALYERFAKEIEFKSSNSSMRMEMEKKSMLLVRRLLERPNSSEIRFDRLQRVRFIFPKEIEAQLVRIHPQYDMNSPVSFAESVYPTRDNIWSCWTTAPILPDYALPQHGKTFITALGIIQNPSKEKVYNHCVNVIKQCMIEQRHGTILAEIMEKIYMNLTNLQFSMQDISLEHSHIPLIYYPDKNEFRDVESVVISCNSDDEIDPYLVKSPSYYGQFQTLFMRIGVANKINAKTYIDILSRMYKNCGSHRLRDPAKTSALKAMQNLFIQIRKCQISDIESTLTDYPIYLLSEEGCLQHGSDLVVCDNTYLRERAQRGLQLNYMTDLSKFAGDALKMNDIVDGVMAFKPRSAPQVLSKIVREDVDMTNITIESQQDDANELQNYLHDEFFITSFCRLTRHAMKKENMSWTGLWEERLKTSIENIRCLNAQGINTVLVKVNPKPSQQIENTQKRKQLCLATDDDKTVLYFESKNSPGWREDVNEAVTVYLNSLIGNCLKNDYIFIACRLLSCKTPKETVHTLDTRSIEAYGNILEESYTPFDDNIPVGAYVPKYLHDKLTNDWSEPDICMALQTDSSTGMYRYVRVLKPVEFDDERRFKVDIGDEFPIEVPASKLFAFRKQNAEKGGYSATLFHPSSFDVAREPVHDYNAALKWQRQAKSDLQSARESFRVYSRIPSNWVLYQAHQATEKSLKAAWYAKDANNVDNSHSLRSLAGDLSENIVTLAGDLENITGYHTHMRYPDTMAGSKIPAEHYTHDDAERCLQIADKILEKVDKEFIRHD